MKMRTLEKTKAKRKLKKNIINTIIISLFISITMWLGIEEYKDNNIEKQNEKTSYVSEKVNTNEEENNTKDIQVNEYEKENIEENYKGYEVAAKLEIPSISLETYVLKKYSTQALNVSVTKFWGADANKIGNFCIAGHNFKNKNMFSNLKKVKIGENLFISDNEVGKVEYEIYDVYTVLPEDVSCLSQETNEQREVTLITCTSDSEKRIIVKAKEKI